MCNCVMTKIYNGDIWRNERNGMENWNIPMTLSFVYIAICTCFVSIKQINAQKVILFNISFACLHVLTSAVSTNFGSNKIYTYVI
jgi:hypothetical protein